MKNILLLASALIFFASQVHAQNQTLPSVQVKNMEGQPMDFKTVADSGKITVISFWATWCVPCIKELEAINEHYADWKEKYNLKLVAVSVDDARTSKKVKPKVLGYGWEYDIVMDENSDLARAMNVNNPPMTFIVDGNGNVVWSHQGYTPGAEEELEAQIKRVAGK
ncbi:MAG: TlpA family protein disulfide reductase [Bacteroidetes bacterium]|jgi:peroxiredoxin|nr:TlpA family protein disulfide reductase [Bacteroidota bacterium]